MKKSFSLILCVVALLSFFYILFLKDQQVTFTPSPTIKFEQTAITYDTPIKKEDLLILVNQNNPIPDSFNLDITSVQYESATFKIHKMALLALCDLIEGAKNQGITLKINSVYRDAAEQEQLYNEKIESLINEGFTDKDAIEKAKREVAQPKFSEHQTGLAIDFGDTSTYNWLYLNAHLYGFTLRYPENKTTITNVIFEPWHFRYVGIKPAKQMYEQQITLEEFLDAES